jgi:short-subunit dehydrogenase
VAGDRGRQSNYVYGSAKAAVTAFTSGLRQRLYPKGVRVLTIKPGFVSTPMTAAFKKGVLWATPAKVAADIVRAMDRRSSVIYTPWFWRPIMWVIRSVPETVFRRLRL